MAGMKKSLEEAIARAEALSASHPGLTYWVLDKPKGKASCTGAGWARDRRVLAGWQVHSEYLNGRKARNEAKPGRAGGNIK